ncbi:uncharacterized protein LOC131851294 [Achroia grisella]|uniref:uncharacterized protein LOC131851294 n=1 Tax=Achroia grisella TaxID=688607 RepID=UPI0027D34224|nr:uncharacterized protein LOC131851294 [Achroia grisella]
MNSTERSQNSIMKISDEQTMMLLDLYEKEECLWNTTLDDYKNKEKRARAAENIARRLNIKDFEAYHVIAKFRNIRNSYCQGLKKLATGHNGRGDCTTAYIPKAVWFTKIDSFLRPHLYKNLIHFANSPVVINNEAICKELKKRYDYDDFSWANEIEEDSMPVPESNNDDISDYDDNSENSVGNASKRSLDSNISDIIHIDGLPSHSTDVNTNDSFDTFGRYVASLLKSMPRKKAISLQPRIVNLITSSILNNNDTS